MKKIICFIIALIFIISPLTKQPTFCYAQTDTQEIEQELEENLEEQIKDLDMSKADQIIFDIEDSAKFFESDSFSSRVKKIISGEISIDANNLISFVVTVLFDDILSFLPYICLIIAIAILYSMVSNSKPDGKSKSIGDIIHFVCYGAIVVIVIVGISNIISLTTTTLHSIKTQMEAIFPILLTVMTAIGGTASVGIYQPAMAVLSSTVISIFINVLLPLFTFKLIFIILSNLTTNIKFNKFSDFFGSCFKWLIGILFTLFMAVVSIQGIMAGSIDGISIRTAKYTIKSAIPLIGGYVSDGVSLILASSVLIKNAVGFSGMLLLFSTILSPILKIIVMSLLLKLCASILEPIADGRVTSFIHDVAKSISLLIALIVGVSFMYFILTGLVLSSVNSF